MNRTAHGFSLVEVLCAVLILGVALVGLTEGVTTALRSNKDSEIQTSAALAAAGQIELLRADGLFTEGTQEGDCGPDLPLYKWKRSISKTSIAGLDEVDVIIQDARSGSALYELKTMLFQPPDENRDSGARKKAESERERRRKRGGRT